MDAATLEKFYPRDAEKRGIEGLVSVAVTLDREGRATDAQILSENPPDTGFGAAASSLAYTMTYSNPIGASVMFTFKVKFALNSARSPPRQSGAQD